MQRVPPQRIRIGKGNADQKRPLNSLRNTPTKPPVQERGRQKATAG